MALYSVKVFPVITYIGIQKQWHTPKERKKERKKNDTSEENCSL